MFLFIHKIVIFKNSACQKLVININLKNVVYEFMGVNNFKEVFKDFYHIFYYFI